MTFEPTGDTCALPVGVARAFGTVGHLQRSVRRMAKRTLIEFQEVSEVSNTSPNARIWSFPETAILCFASRCSRSLISPRTSQGCGCILQSRQKQSADGHALGGEVANNLHGYTRQNFAVRRRSHCIIYSFKLEVTALFYRRFSQWLAHCKISAKLCAW